MKHSTERILVTHVGSLARPKDLMEMLVARNDGKSYDAAALAKRTREAVAEVVQKQIECGVDVVNDGELGKSNFSRYTEERLGGFVERAADADFKPTSIFGRDMIEFTEYFNRGGRTSIGHHARVFYCVEPLKYIGQDEVKSDIDNLKAALQGKQLRGSFLPAIAPGTMEHWMKNEYYNTDEAYLFAIAEAMREEYKAIVDAGFRPADRRPGFSRRLADASGNERGRLSQVSGVRIDALNHGLHGLPEDRIRFHMCWGSYHGPHKYDIPLKDIVDLILKVRRRRLLHRGVESLSRSRVARVGRSETARRQDVSFPASSATTAISSNIPRRSPIAWCATPKSSAAKTSSPAPTAASAPESVIPKWAGRSFRRWPKARASRPKNCGADSSERRASAMQPVKLDLAIWLPRAGGRTLSPRLLDRRRAASFSGGLRSCRDLPASVCSIAPYLFLVGLVPLRLTAA